MHNECLRILDWALCRSSPLAQALLRESLGHQTERHDQTERSLLPLQYQSTAIVSCVLPH
jgi:hypothetical protein